MRPFDPFLPRPVDQYTTELTKALGRLFREFKNDSDLLAYGHVTGKKSRGTAAPTTGTWALGDEVFNSNPSELGTAGSKYVIRGWECVSGGTPGTWVQQRFLTGN